ncbi:hypothetical protein L1N85_20645 [Paenibacillus alkaliterrae]|uniref:hypothetical protein n=1 Tax=Paenibacillus alkaliterrae TaxID=320909 RepID=UPI001F2EE205|nr:hypothetical protein [Paenibacillus alkaliterrae]MCF2940804.1 hypothetical protein [Paenibacillus alkaliterrae]
MENPVLDQQQMKQLCENHKHRYVLAQTHDGWCCDGFLEHVDDEVVCLAVPCGMNEGDNRAFLPQFGYPSFGYPPYGYPIYPYPYFPRRRFVRRVFPLSALLALSLLPYF